VYIYIVCLCATCFGHTGPSLSDIFKEFTALCTLSILLLRYAVAIVIVVVITISIIIIVIIINFGVTA
jgi:hypothetical protein